MLDDPPVQANLVVGSGECPLCSTWKHHQAARSKQMWSDWNIGGQFLVDELCALSYVPSGKLTFCVWLSTLVNSFGIISDVPSGELT